jgi:hypothetical protein
LSSTQDVVIHDKKDVNTKTAHFWTTLRHGKGAAFNGPFTIRAVAPADFLKRLAAWTQHKHPPARLEKRFDEHNMFCLCEIDEQKMKQ